jgi:tetratricopeptide (TPR) repeat protein
LVTATLFQHGTRFAQALFDPQERTRRPAMLKQFALRDLYKVLEHDDSLAQVHMMIARLEAVNVGRTTKEVFEKGKASADKAIELLTDDEPMLSKAYVLRAGYARSGTERMEYLTKAIETDPKNWDALRLRGKNLLVSGELLAAAGQLEEAKAIRQKAIDDFAKLLEANPNDPDALQAVAELLGRLGNFEEALANANKAIEQNPRISSLYILRGRLYQRQKEFDKAIPDLNRAIDLQPDSFIAFLDRAEVHWESGNKKSAAKDYGRAREARELQDKDLAETVLRRITVRAEGNVARAIEQMRQYMELDLLNAKTDDRSPDPDYRYQIGRTYLNTGRPKEAVEMLTILLDSLDKKSRDTKTRSARFLSLRDRADAYLSIGKHPQAVADYEAAIQLQPSDDRILNNLAWVLATSTFDEVRSAGRAIEIATKACKVTDYKQAHILSTLAAAYAESGDFERAVEMSTRAVELGGDGETPATQAQLKNELESYKQKKPWRELQDATVESGDASVEETITEEETTEEAEEEEAEEEAESRSEKSDEAEPVGTSE